MAITSIAAYASYYFFYDFPERQLRLSDAPSYSFVVENGSSLSRVVHQLHQEGVVEHPALVRLYARLTKKTAIRSGEYIVKRQDTIEDLLSVLNKGKVSYRSVTLIEGWSLAQIQSYLQSTFTVDDAAFSPEAYGLESNSLEGWIFPDTYFYTLGDDVSTIIGQAVQKMQQVLAQQWQLRDSNLPYETPYEMLVMASIIEKETAVDAEREMIASVFINRLRKNMKLQTDPTVIYALGDSFDGDIKRKHLRYDSPFNTYVYKGLPPTPIAMPALRSIEAAAKPANSAYLYFVAKGNGETKFSTTLEEHNAAVNKYQRSGRVKDYRSSPVKEAENE